MAFNKVSRPSIERVTNLAQELPIQAKEVRPEEIEETISEEDFGRILNDLVEQQRDNGGAVYNSMADGELYFNTGASIDKDKLRALRNRNRTRAVQYQEEIEKYKAAYQTAMREAGTSIPYDKDNNDKLFVFMGNLFGTNSAEVTSAQYGALKEIQKASASNESNKYKGRVSATATVNKDPNTPLDLSGFGLEKPVQASDLDIELVVTGIELYETGVADVPESGMPLGAALGIGYDSTMEAEEMNRGVISVLGQVDEKNSYIDELFGNGPPSTIRSEAGGRPQSYNLSEIWENCFDCFFAAWTPDADFVLSLDIELRVNALLNTIQALLDAIKYALDLPAIITANMCSLMRLGVLCPIEIAFLLSSLTALLRFTIGEVVLSFGDFLQALIAAILNPLLNALEVAAGFSIGPLNIYTGCVLRTILSNDQVAWTGRFTRSQIGDILNGRNTERTANIPEEEKMGLIEKSREWNPALLSGLVLTSSTSRTNIDFMDMLGLADTIDPLAMVESALLESNGKLQNVYAWIKNALAGLRNFAMSKSIPRIELTAKVVALSTFIGVLIAIVKLLTGNVPVCDEVTDADTGTTTIEPRFTPEEFIELIGLPPLLTLRQPTPTSDTIIVDGEPVPGNPGSVLVNTITEERFSIINCEKGKVKNVSNIDINTTLRQLGLA